ncbi:hypothetical protein GQ55_3G367500 [Panicum hallii var. hallii]|uniref:Uncharacterized protein n=1 Tax=Panicum hallii var. hallii TaxID=1504633 RepID=A0A2T7EG62_9POAL|nr:hypothetical protein GQ55_3G367500 [Panicum hallii var. hallii]
MSQPGPGRQNKVYIFVGLAEADENTSNFVGSNQADENSGALSSCLPTFCLSCLPAPAPPAPPPPRPCAATARAPPPPPPAGPLPPAPQPTAATPRPAIYRGAANSAYRNFVSTVQCHRCCESEKISGTRHCCVVPFHATAVSPAARRHFDRPFTFAAGPATHHRYPAGPRPPAPHCGMA